MARRMEIELTSKRDDGTWTWRAAGAREPKGTVDGAIVPPATQVGDVVRVEVEGFLDGISIVGVVPPKTPRSEPERLDLLTPRSETPLVTTRLARSSRRERPRRDERGDRGDRENRRRGRSDRGDRGPRNDRDREGDRQRGERGERRERPAPPPAEAKPKPKRLRPAKVHRSALLESLPAEQRPIAEQLLQGGIPAVRQAIEKQNDELKAAGKSQVAAEPLIEIAERLRNRAQAAAWRDRADAALTQVDDLDLRDLRSVVNAADDGGRDEAARDVAAQLRDALIQRVEKEHVAWVDEVGENLRDGRVVRALRLSSRPPKAGSPLPPDLSAQLIAATAAALTSETGPQRWATILDALAFSPIRRRVVPESLPDKLSADLRTTIARLGTRLPEVAHIFDITPEEVPARPPRQGGQARRGKGGGGGAKGERGDQADKPKSRNKRRADKPPKRGAPTSAAPAAKGADRPTPEPEQPEPEQPQADGAAAQAPVEPEAPAATRPAADPELPADETIAAETSAGETSVGETSVGETSVGETSADDLPAGETSADELPADETSVDETIAANAAGTETAAGVNGTAEANGESTADTETDADGVRVDG